MTLDYFERKALRQLVSTKSVPGQVDHLELAGLVKRRLADDDLEELKGLVRAEFGIVEFEKGLVERAPILIWRRLD